MRYRILLITVLWLITCGTAWSYDLLILQSQRSPAYDEVLRGFRSVSRFSERLVVLTDYREIDLVRIVREEHPIAILTLGDKALAATRKVRQTPVIALMALSYKGGMTGYTALTGVEVQSPPERYLPIFNAIKAHKIGIVANSARSGAYLKQARKVAAEFGIDLIIREATSSREVSGQLASLAGVVDALWMLPDSVTSSGEAADAHFLFSASQKVPVVTYSSAYLDSGAAVALDFDRFEMGKQGGEMAVALMNGSRISSVTPASPRKTTIKTSVSVLRSLGIRLDVSGSRNRE